MMGKIKVLRKDVFYPHEREKVWAALTTPQALAEWLMPNDFELVVGKRFQFRVDGMLSLSGITDCEILEIKPPERLVYTWICQRNDRPAHPAMTLVWTLREEEGGTRLLLEQSGLEALSFMWRLSMNFGWGRMLKSLLPRVLANVAEDGSFTPGAITKRDYGTKTVPSHFAK